MIAEFLESQPEQVAVPTPEVELPVVEQQIEVPVPEVPIEIDTPPPIAAQSTPTPSTDAVGEPVAATQLQADRQLTPPIYPPTSRRLGEEGTVRLLIYVLPDGRVGDVKIDKSSGFPRLDEAAMNAARKDWRFRPATQGGAAVAAWGRYAVTFNLKNA
ncbi:MAG: TonB family protein [Gammaproteobacteria bacterium]|nr:TonB family protein [Gammaproteobacteria bacterium]